MSDGKLTGSLQESVVTLILMNEDQGKVACGLIDVELFEPPYDDIVKRALQYRKRFKKAPGEAHIDELFDHVLSDPKNKKQNLYQQVLGNILDLNKGMNAEFVLSRIAEFMRHQQVYSSILEAGERMLRGGDDALPEAENILYKGLKFQPDSTDIGTYLSDKKNIGFLTQYSGCDYTIGIETLNRRGIGLTKGETMGFMAAKGRGKTWMCIHTGVQCLLQKAKVLHITLEMKNERIMPRYLRKLFAIAEESDKYSQTFLEFDDLERVIGFKSKMAKAKLHLRDPAIEKKIAALMTRFGSRLDRLLVKSFPTNRLTMDKLVAYLDNLEASEGFMPDVLILDYPKLMRMGKASDLRVDLGRNMEDLRGLCDERKMAGFFPFQGNRATEDVETASASNIGEDYSLSQTLDNLIIYSQTKAEKQLNLARLYMDKVRAKKDGFSVLITQDYETGQFVKQSAYIPNNYFKLIKGSAEDEE